MLCAGVYVCMRVCVCVFERKGRGLGVTFVGCPRLEAICSSIWGPAPPTGIVRFSVPIGSELYSPTLSLIGVTFHIYES